MCCFQNAPDIIGDWWRACHQPEQPFSYWNPSPPLIGTRHQPVGERPSRRFSRLLMVAINPKTNSHFGVDASHRAKDKRTHRTHWPAADHLDFLRVQYGCACVKPPVLSVIPCLGADARRMRTEDEL
jgi:hypothetical protein